MRGSAEEVGVESLLTKLKSFGIGRVAAVLGASAGVAAVLIALMLRVGAEPKALLYSNLDLKEASQITAALDAAGVKYEAKGDGSTLMVSRDKVAATRLLLSGKGLPTSGSVGYEIFDNAPAMGQTDFVQNLNRQRALEGELARDIRSIRGVQSARVLLNMPKRQLFEQDPEQPSASIMLVTGGRALTSDQVRAVRNLVAGPVPGLKPERITVADQNGDLLAGLDDPGASGASSSAARNEVEERVRKRVKDLVEGVVGPGKARVTVTADLDLSRVTTQSRKFDPDGQVVRSTQTSDEKQNELKPSAAGLTSASQNVPGALASASPNGSDSSNNNKQEETTNYEISETTRTEVQEPGSVKRLSVAVAVDGVTAMGAKGKPGAYTPRSAQEIQHIQDLVRAAVGFDEKRGDQIQVLNVRFDRPEDAAGTASGSPLALDKNDLMRVVELGVLLAVAGLTIFFVARPMLKGIGGDAPALANAAGGRAVLAGPGGAALLAGDGLGGQLALPSAEASVIEQKIDLARIEGQVKASTVRQVAEFVEKHPEDSISILRNWLHES